MEIPVELPAIEEAKPRPTFNLVVSAGRNMDRVEISVSFCGHNKVWSTHPSLALDNNDVLAEVLFHVDKLVKEIMLDHGHSN